MRLTTRGRKRLRPLPKILYSPEDADLVESREWYVTKTGYLRCFWIDLDGKWHYESIHRLIMNPPKGMEVDHLNGNKADNRRENLRVCTHAENMKSLTKRRASELSA